jgi:hypothetical protein
MSSTYSLDIDAALKEIKKLSDYLSNKCPNLTLGIVPIERGYKKSKYISYL